MCYSVESSLKTTSLSLFAIIYLLSSGIPHFQWIGVTLIGWCGMQFAELLLWLTNPRKGCTFWNKVITMTLIPFILVLQGLAPLWGSIIVFPWDKSSSMRKYFMGIYTAIFLVWIYWHHYLKPEKYCTTVTDRGNLYWLTYKETNTKLYYDVLYIVWEIILSLPLLVFWNKSLILPILIMIIPIIGFILGLKTDARGSIWCHYTSYTSIIAIICLFMQQNGIYNFMSPSSFHF